MTDDDEAPEGMRRITAAERLERAEAALSVMQASVKLMVASIEAMKAGREPEVVELGEAPLLGTFLMARLRDAISAYMCQCPGCLEQLALAGDFEDEDDDDNEGAHHVAH